MSLGCLLCLKMSGMSAVPWSAAVVPVHAHSLTLVWTVVFHAGRTVLVLHALRAPVLVDITHQVLGTLGVILTGSPGVLSTLLSLGQTGDTQHQSQQHSCVHLEIVCRMVQRTVIKLSTGYVVSQGSSAPS